MRLFRRKKEELLARELAILRAEYPGQYSSVTIRSFYDGRRTCVAWRVYTAGNSGTGGTFREAKLDFKIEEGKNHAN